MEVGHGFAAVRTVVDDQSIAGLFQAQLRGDVSGSEQQMADDAVVFDSGFGDAGNRFLRDDQRVDGRLRFDVAEGQHQVVFVNDVGWNLTLDNLLEDAFAHNLKGAP